MNCYLEALHAAFPDIEAGDRRNGNWGTLLAEVVPEILSRLCCKCSRGSRDKLLDFLLEVYGSEHRWKFRGIAHLAERLLEGFPVHERVAAISKLLQFPILDVAGRIEETEYANPFIFVHVEKEWVSRVPVVADGILDVFFERAASDVSAVREWALTTLGQLHHLGLLGPAQSKRLGDVLWSRTGEDGMPVSRSYYRHAFLSFRTQRRSIRSRCSWNTCGGRGFRPKRVERERGLGSEEIRACRSALKSSRRRRCVQRQLLLPLGDDYFCRFRSGRTLALPDRDRDPI